MGNSMPGPLLEICLPKDDEVPAEAPAAPPLPRPARLDDQAARADFEQKFANGLRLIKFGRNGASQRRVFSLVDAARRTFTWRPMPGDKSQPRMTPRKVYALTDIKRVRTALEPDPKNPTHGGTEALRKGLHPSHAGRAFVLDMADGRTLDLVARSDAEASEYVRGLRLLVADAVAKER